MLNHTTRRFPGAGRPLVGLLSGMTGLLLLAASAPAAPTAKIEPAQIELGEILEGNQYERFLTVTNAGDGVLVLEDVKTSCGCTAAGVEGLVELKSGESKEIRVTFNSRNMEGNVEKKITVTTNDPAQKHREVRIRANVHMPVRCTPRHINLDRIGPKEEFAQTVTLEADRDLNLEIKDAFIIGGRLHDRPSKLFELKIGEMRVEGDRDAIDFDVRLIPGQTPQRLSETLMVVTNLPGDRDTLKMSIRGELMGRIEVKPAFAVLRLANPGEESIRDVALTASEGEFEVLSAVVEESPITVEVLERGGRQAKIRLRYVGEEEGTSGVKTLKIETDDPNQKIIEVPVRYHTRARPRAAAKAEEG